MAEPSDYKLVLARRACQDLVRRFGRRTRRGRLFGGQTYLAQAIRAATGGQITAQAVQRWRVVPVTRIGDVLAAARLRGIKLRAADVRPDLLAEEVLEEAELDEVA